MEHSGGSHQAVYNNLFSSLQVKVRLSFLIPLRLEVIFWLVQTSVMLVEMNHGASGWKHLIDGDKLQLLYPSAWNCGRQGHYQTRSPNDYIGKK